MKIEESHIFKFAPINAFTFKNLLLSQLWFGPPENMNDLLEGLIKIKNTDFKPSKEALNHFIKSNQLDQYYWNPKQEIDTQGFIKFFVDNWYHIQRNQYGISCFSSTPNEPLMWSHYADKHKGICLIYDKEELLSCLKDSFLKFEYCPVNYKKRPILELFEDKGEVLFKSSDPVLISKDSKWKYEKEIRFLAKLENKSNFKGRTFTIYHSALKGIIYGANINSDDIDSISLILRNDPLYINVKEYLSEIDYEKGTVSFYEG
ncbi:MULTISPECIES: DUF2971 domain-containing protein [unclassified Imperialibacter]|uniref:DUF2971 domain-containing protein n=1 Tax=unclassified Imperialibacter TaxID=2629706 RepID=UPI0012587C3C|nr:MULTISPECIES: DUF2971 domain-containing protein [unclassified Imperialibacter]CAD5278865.1 conserved hypothetical protein [Imperialibacter sp. 89]CAD5292993.1 conserved hypothetical protein [Imperialibacter sp. 75]VVS99249.1 conserved hypothetical protein [Imperialibacter sp. EC-SDR9]